MVDMAVVTQGTEGTITAVDIRMRVDISELVIITIPEVHTAEVVYTAVAFMVAPTLAAVTMRHPTDMEAFQYAVTEHPAFMPYLERMLHRIRILPERLFTGSIRCRHTQLPSILHLDFVQLLLILMAHQLNYQEFLLQAASLRWPDQLCLPNRQNIPGRNHTCDPGYRAAVRYLAENFVLAWFCRTDP